MRRDISYGLVALAIAGCSAGQADQSAVKAVDNARQQALNNRNITRYLSLLSPSYRDGKKDFSAEKQELESSFAAFERVAYRPLSRSIAVHGDTAIISGNYLLKVTMHGKTMEFSGKEDIRLKKEAGNWLIIGGL